MEALWKFLTYVYGTAGVPMRFAYIFWSMFIGLYWLIGRYEKRHEIQKPREVYIKNYHGTLYLFGGLSILLYHGSTVWGWMFYKSIAPEGPEYYLSGAFFLNFAGFLLMLFGLAIVALARVDLNGFWGIHIYYYPLGGWRLVESGIYSKVRHPIYFGQICMTIGTVFLSNDWWLMVFPLGTVLLSVWRALREERYLATIFPIEFEDYRNKVSFLIPWIK